MTATIYVLIETAAGVGAVSKLRVKNLYDSGDQYCLHFDDKGGKSREIPVRHDDDKENEKVNDATDDGRRYRTNGQATPGRLRKELSTIATLIQGDHHYRLARTGSTA